MLVLTRSIGEKIVIGDGIEVTVAAVRGRHVRLGIVAPASVRVARRAPGNCPPPSPQGPPQEAPGHESRPPDA